MQKKIIALAVAGLVSGAAFAQSNVTIYGAADISYNYLFSSANHSKSQSMIASGEQRQSVLGFKGSEDLGNGMKANFDLVMGFNLNNGGTDNDSDATSFRNGNGIFGRKAIVGLSSATWGQIDIGRQQTLNDRLMGGFDASGRQTINQVATVMASNGRFSNMALYQSPVWSGLQVQFGVSTGTVTEGAPVQNTTGAQSSVAPNRALSLGSTYNNGPLKVGFAYEWTKKQDVNNTVATVASFDAANQWTVAAGYDFGVVNLSVEAGRINYSTDGTETKDYRNQWTIGAMVPLGSKDRIGLNYARADVEFITAGVASQKQSQYGVTYYHDLSKRTNLWAAYGHITQDNSGVANSMDSALDPVNNDGQYRNGIQVGLSHAF